jgi:hypothetical protein
VLDQNRSSGIEADNCREHDCRRADNITAEARTNASAVLHHMHHVYDCCDCSHALTLQHARTVLIHRISGFFPLRRCHHWQDEWHD